MVKAALAGALAFAMVNTVSLPTGGVGIAPAMAQDNVVITESHISRLKRSLRLTPAQQVHWYKVEAALRAYLTRVASENTEGSYYQRTRARIAGYALNAAAMQRLSTAARPLIATLDEDQKREGMQAIHAMGLASMF